MYHRGRESSEETYAFAQLCSCWRCRTENITEKKKRGHTYADKYERNGKCQTDPWGHGMGYQQVKDQGRKPKGSELPRLLLSPVGWQISCLGDQRIKVFFHSSFCFFLRWNHIPQNWVQLSTTLHLTQLQCWSFYLEFVIIFTDVCSWHIHM